jgi:hypothetical protein
MPFQPVPNGASAVIHATLDGETCDTTLGFSLNAAGPVAPAALAALATGLVNYWTSNQLAILPVEYVFNRIDLRAEDVEFGPQSETTGFAGATGSLVGNIMPNNVTLAIAFRTGLAGRTNRGRNYWPSFLESEVNGQRVSAAKIGAILGAYSGMLGPDSIAAGWTWSVLSRKELVPGGPGRAVGVTTVSVRDNVIDSQRRRLPGRGN